MGHGRYRPIVASSRLDPRWAHHRAGFYLCDKSLAAGVGPFPPLPPVPRDEVLGQASPKTSQLAEFIRTHHPGALKKLEQERRIFEWQQVQALVWLGEDVAPLKEKILGWKQPLTYLKQYEQHGYPLFSSEMGVILSRALLGVPLSELPPEFVAYLDSRRRANGSFNNTPAGDGSDGHVLSTWWGLQAMRVLARDAEKRNETIAWLRACQLANGGFTFAQKPEFGGVDDVAYT